MPLTSSEIRLYRAAFIRLQTNRCLIFIETTMTNILSQLKMGQDLFLTEVNLRHQFTLVGIHVLFCRLEVMLEN